MAIHGGMGLGFFPGDFDEEAHWALGFKSPEDFRASGSPSISLNGRRRTMDIDGDTAFFFSARGTWAFADSWLLELFVRYMQLDANATFTGTVHGKIETQKEGTFPLENLGYGVGVRRPF